jgi:DNA ligase-associated metallophosphoesterase
VPDYRTLLVADLHFEKGSSRAERGTHLPPYDTRSTLYCLNQAVARWRPQRLISLGDSFHDRKGFDRLHPQDREEIAQIAGFTEIVWLTGNHDPVLSTQLPGCVAREAAIGPLTLRHAPEAGATGEIAGHLHPVAAVVKRGRKLRRKCFVGDAERLIMPAFGAYTGGLSVTTAAFAPYFGIRGFQAWLIGRTGVHAFPSSTLRD